MNFQQLVLERYSCRSYQPKAVPTEKIKAIFDIARYAPSAVNYQPWRFVVIADKNLLNAVHTVYARDWIKTAPAIILAIGNKAEGWVRSDGKNHTDIDLAIIIDHLTLAATEHGLATCWICNFNTQKISELFKLSDNDEPVELISLGYAANDAKKPQKKRKELDDIVYFNSYLND